MDAEIVVRAQHGDQASFASLMEAIDDRFHGVAFGILRDMELAQDAVQAALLTLWRDLPKLRDPAAFEAWSYRLLVRACYAESRRARRWLPNLAGGTARERPVEGGIAAIVDRDQLERGFRRLSVDQRAVIVLHHYLDMPLERVAHTLGIPEGTARSRLFRAVRALRASLEADARVSATALPAAEGIPPEVVR
jgi:RNA polymerase sigma-70 factor (ECF subfamily)